jgi:hypothetical protein
MYEYFFRKSRRTLIDRCDSFPTPRNCDRFSCPYNGHLGHVPTSALVRNADYTDKWITSGLATNRESVENSFCIRQARCVLKKN